MKQLQKQEKWLNRLAIGISILVFILVGMMRRVKIQSDIDFSFLPALNAGINSVTAVVLLLALWMVKTKNFKLHQQLMISAIGLSSLFLMCYVLYHFTTAETKFGGEGVVRIIYLVLLALHIVLAGGILPFILFTYIRALIGQFERHKKMARIVFPFWLFVAVSGPIIYWMLRPYY